MSEVAVPQIGVDLPIDWKAVKLEDICTVDNGRGFKKTEWAESGLPIIRIQNLKNDEASFNYFNGELATKHKVKQGDLLFAWSGTPGTSFGAHIWSGGDAALNQHIFNVRFDEKLINAKYFYFALNQNVTRYVEQAQGGVGLAHITKGTFMASEIPLMPLEQQKRIVAKIEELFSHIDAGIDALNKAKQLLKQYRQSVLKAAVTGELTKDWREKNKDKLEPASELLESIDQYRNIWLDEQIEKGNGEAKRLKNKLKKHEFENIDSKYIPDGWVSVSLLKLCKAVVDCHNKTAPYVEKGIPLIRTANIRHGVINFEYKMKYITNETYTYWAKRCPPEAGDILFTREAPMGESAIVPEGVQLCMGQRMMLLRPNHRFTDVQYLQLSLLEPLFQSRFQNFKVGVGVQHLRVGDVEKSVISMPSLEEQKEIVRVAIEKLDSISRLEFDIDSKIKKAEKNKQSILASAFSGQLN